MANLLWTDKKRPCLGLPWSFTRYTITPEKLLIHTGFLHKKEEEIRLYRILDVTLRQSLGQRIFGLGTIHCCSADHSTPEFDIRSVKHSRKVRDLLSDQVEQERERKRISAREFMGGAEDEDMREEGWEHEH